jgi:arsenate reductase
MTVSQAASVAIVIVTLCASPALAQGTSAKRALASQTVLFVCEHGGAKSVIAAAHFNKIALQRGLPYRAIARGTSPDAAVPAGVRQGLEEAGLELTIDRPMLVAQADVNNATRVVTFEVALPGSIASTKSTLTDLRAVPAVSADFGVASADIKRRVEALIDELAKKSRHRLQ